MYSISSPATHSSFELLNMCRKQPRHASRRGSMNVDDDELIIVDGSNVVLTADHGDLGGHGFWRRVRRSGTGVM